MSVDINALWDHRDPGLSEQRFRQALLEAVTSDDRLLLETQIARTFGLRREFDRAREVLAAIQAKLETGDSEVHVRYWLELGRTYCSATHPPETQTEEARQHAREAYTLAFDHARSAGLDGLAVDALHMMTAVDPSPESQIEWNTKALAFMDSSKDVAAKKWEGSLRNNLGYALHLAERYDEALVEFELSRLARQRAGNKEGEGIARWMIGRTLRVMDRLDEALAIQLQLEKELRDTGSEDPYVFQELEILHRKLGDSIRADHYKSRSS
jgi:tetratricopeptide (TPR) repeat protein